MEDGWEYQSALDLEQRSCPTAGDYPVPCAAAMPYPTQALVPEPARRVTRTWTTTATR